MLDLRAQLDYFTQRNQWAAGRLLGDILPDHPVWGPVLTGLALANLVLKVVYLPGIRDLLNQPSPLQRWLDAAG